MRPYSKTRSYETCLCSQCKGRSRARYMRHVKKQARHAARLDTAKQLDQVCQFKYYPHLHDD